MRHSFDLDREKKRGVGRFLLFAPQRRWTSLWPQPKQEDAGQDLETGRQGRKASLAYSCCCKYRSRDSARILTCPPIDTSTVRLRNENTGAGKEKAYRVSMSDTGGVMSSSRPTSTKCHSPAKRGKKDGRFIYSRKVSICNQTKPKLACPPKIFHCQQLEMQLFDGHCPSISIVSFF